MSVRLRSHSMTRQRRVFTATLLAGWAAMALACGGVGNKPDPPQKEVDAKPGAKPAKPEAPPEPTWAPPTKAVRQGDLQVQITRAQPV